MRTAVFLVSLLIMTASARASEPLYPLVSAWEQSFRVESRTSMRDGKPVVIGTVWNTADWGARHIRLLVDGVDASGTPVAQRVVWLGVDLAAGTHAYFEVPMPTSTSYRVSVFSFDSGRGRC